MSEFEFPSSIDLRNLPYGVDRRRFIRLTAGAAAAAGMVPGAMLPGSFSPTSLAAQERPIGPGAQEQDRPPPIPLGNSEPPAFAFQAYPGGNGALLEKLWRESGTSPFERHVIDIEPWTGPVPTLEEDIAFLPVHRLAALIRGRHILPSELTEIYLERLKRYDPVLLCVVNFLEGRAREEAQQADAEIKAWQWKGPLHGIPYGVKDLFSVSGAPTAWGAEPYKDQVIDEDAEVVRRLRAAGAILIAKLSTGEFAMGDNWYRGRTKNPWNVEQGSSGSSAGPASATAAGCVAFGIGTETQGSITSPARRCGLSALRPTFGRITRHGGMVLSWTMDKPGPLCRTIEDCALVFNEIHGADEKDPATLTTPFRFQRDLDLFTLRIGYDDRAPEAFVEALRGLGADLEPMPEIPSGSSNALNVESAAAFDFHIAPILEAEAEAAALDPDQPDQPEEGERRRRGRFRSGRETLAMDYVQSQRRRHILMMEMAEVMEDFDMFVSGRGHVGLTNQTGHPAVVVPYGFDEEDPQPITTTIIGDLFADDKILSVAHAYQVSTDWHLRRPDLSGVG
jgi:Asp-tRNA(Asn)/Glu-tRNA(Gln) amidotransferase A subunit family amidase